VARAVDERSTELDVLLQRRRDKAAAKRFFRKLLRSHPVPQKLVTDQLRSYPAAKAEVPELAGVKHIFVKASARVNNRAENSHQPTRRRERQMQGFRDPRRTQAFLFRFGSIRQHFDLPRHLMNTRCHRIVLQARLLAWHGWTSGNDFASLDKETLSYPKIANRSRQLDKAAGQYDVRAADERREKAVDRLNVHGAIDGVKKISQAGELVIGKRFHGRSVSLRCGNRNGYAR
jgi:putative transposase